ncbi:mll6212 [Mesorhizobium japonicum MAFF 303099]|uniref:Mll6212 protein n=1 Tax=Mesorhizobium japonicum (strain LMG 29417 / CECT 9101 / MAFF 303099) TaxID=266835 RepID=Q98A04_RHILO|nr:mll6212 [Mesorhizobium japonicum MAFF 303099]
MDNSGEFVNSRLIEYCIGHGIELARARPYRKNDQAWIEQKYGAAVRKLLGGSQGDHTPLRSIQAVRELLPAFVQTGCQKQRDGAKVAKRYHPPQAPGERSRRRRVSRWPYSKA